MKKICFLGIMLIAAHGIASAQLSVNLNGGTGLWMATCNNNTLLGEKVTSPNITPTFYVGALLNNTLQSGVTLEAGVNFHLLTSNGSYKSSVIADVFPFLLCFSLLFFSQLFVRPPETAILLFCISFSFYCA